MMKPQPLEILTLPNALLNVETVTAVVGVSRATIYRLMNSGSFPQPVKFGERCTRWRALDVSAWLDAQVKTLAPRSPWPRLATDRDSRPKTASSADVVQ
jgi:prophage regulatory protein